MAGLTKKVKVAPFLSFVIDVKRVYKSHHRFCDTKRNEYNFQNNFCFTRLAKSPKTSQSEKKEKPMKRPRVPPMSPTRDARS